MTAKELVKATNTKIIFIAFKEDVDKVYPNKEIDYSIKYKSGIGYGKLYLVDNDRFKRHYDIGYCIKTSCSTKISANDVATWVDKTKIFKVDRFEVDFENQTLLVHLKFR